MNHLLLTKKVVYATLYTKVIISGRKQKTDYSNLFLRQMYKVLRAVLFCFDPEWVHYFSMNGLKLLCSIPGIKSLVASSFKPQGGNPYEFLNIKFPNRVGLGAGFDKNAKYLNELEALGFGDRKSVV